MGTRSVKIVDVIENIKIYFRLAPINKIMQITYSTPMATPKGIIKSIRNTAINAIKPLTEDLLIVPDDFIIYDN